jgi:hypothetical protein
LRRAVRAALLCAALAVALSGLAVPVARADGDPASDVLLGEAVYYPYTPPVSRPVERALDREAAAAKRAHFPVKVALIASAIDLGVIPALFEKPQKYAAFLDQEISFQGRQPLLVVMPAGYGVAAVPAAAAAAVAKLAKPASASSNDLAKAATTAVVKMAGAAGHPVAGPAQPGSGSDTGLIAGITAGAVVLAAALAAAVVSGRRRRRGR